jgi:hypothetical protein
MIPVSGLRKIPSPGLLQVATVIRKYLSSALGVGLTRNVADCYEHILNVYEPGDRIFLFGFSRGAYTVRSVAGVINLCGVPIKDAEGKPIPRAGRALRPAERVLLASPGLRPAQNGHTKTGRPSALSVSVADNPAQDFPRRRMPRVECGLMRLF